MNCLGLLLTFAFAENIFGLRWDEYLDMPTTTVNGDGGGAG